MATSEPTSNITYVSALYDIYGQKSVSDRLTRDVQDLICRPLALIIYLDPYYASIVAPMPKGPNVTLIVLPLAELHTYNMIVQNKSLLHLPEVRTPEKDTHEYMALMNTKAEFMYRAASVASTEYVAWIDAGVAKMLVDKDASFDRLARTHLSNVPHILIPGCYRKAVSFDQLANNVSWVFLGTFLISHRSFLLPFYNLSLQAVARFMIRRRVTWEVNVWVDIWNKYPDTFEWYTADHNDKLTHVPTLFML
jgi:hypothetical protein